jgi:membrane-associated protease RseP (regulator of RpoE activity)
MESHDRSEHDDADIIQAEVVEVTPGTPWEWREVRPLRPRRRVGTPLLLFIATCVSTLYVGTVQAPDGLGTWANILYGLHYAVPVMIILLCHEMGHFVQAQHYGVYASWPYFIPMPFPPFGTFGAVIAMEPRIGGRRALFDIGISGPLVGLVPTLIFLIVGLRQSHYALPVVDALRFNDPALFRLLARMILGPMPHGYEIVKDPMAFAGWVGLFITSLNLIPIGQLDGGHVLYALLREKAHRVATALLFGALFLVIFQFKEYGSWAVMLALLFFLGPIHPPTADDQEPLGAVRIVLGWLTLAFILIGFTPRPIVMP